MATSWNRCFSRVRTRSTTPVRWPASTTIRTTKVNQRVSTPALYPGSVTRPSTQRSGDPGRHLAGTGRRR